MASNAGDTNDEDQDDGRGDNKAERRRRPPTAAVTEDLGAVKTDLGALVRTHPAGSLAAALGVGYALGGGLFTRLTSRLVRLSLRLGFQFAVLPVLEREIASLVGLEKGGEGEGPGRPPDKGRTRH